jgi:PAS domain S-box-containing protein
MGQAPSEFEQGERFFKELADNAPVMIWRSGRDKLCDWFNKPWLDFVGRGMERELGNGWAENVHRDDFDRCLKTYVTSFDARQPFSMTYRLRRHDGVYRYILDNGAPFFRNGEFAGYFGSCIDITEQQLLEAQLRQAQKMEAVGKVTGGVAHDFNNILQVISGNLELLAPDLTGNARAEQRLKTARLGLARGAKLASQLLAFARRQSQSPKSINVGRIILSMDDMLRRALGEAIEIETAIDGGIWNTLADPVQVEMALLNLAINARDAMQGRGKLRIDVKNAVLREDDHPSDLGTGAYVTLSVTDTGCGMANEVLEKVLEPFFTTKPEGKGSGLGLSIVNSFVQQCGGHLTIESEPGLGSTFRIFLPRTLQEEEGNAPAVKSTPVSAGAETVLIVEDDDDVRTTTAAMLAELGYRVLQAKNAASAYAMIEAGTVVDALFADLITPGPMSTPELAWKARQKIKGLALLFASGNGDSQLSERSRTSDSEIVAKPYTRDELATKLARLLRLRPAQLPAEMKPLSGKPTTQQIASA